MTPQELASIIFVFCGFANPGGDNEAKFACVDHMVNCSVVDGKIEKQTVESCKKEYDNIRQNK